MDLLSLQYKIRPHSKLYFSERKVSLSMIENARSKDTGEQASLIDAVIRAISREGSFLPLSEEEKDILGIRFDWAWQEIQKHILNPAALSAETVSEEQFEHFLIVQWHSIGRISYKNIAATVRGLTGNKRPPPDDVQSK